MDWQPVQKPAEAAERRLLDGILSGFFPMNSNLPGERELAERIGVTRPTLREALQRLARDGWLEIQQGKPTRVRDYWREGSLAVLSILAESPAHQSPDFVFHLLELRVLIAPEYTRQAIELHPDVLVILLEGYKKLVDRSDAYALFDWELHKQLTQNSTNPVFRLLLNSFERLYLLMGENYFVFPECRQHSRDFYRSLLECAVKGRSCDAGALSRRVMEESLTLWRQMQEKSR